MGFGVKWNDGTDQIPSPAAEGVDGLHDFAVLLAVPVAGAAVDGVVGEDEAGQKGQEGG